MNRNDRRIALAAIIIGALALVGIFLTGDGVSESSGASEASEVQKSQRTQKPQPNYSQYEVAQPETFPFDPNTADSTQLLRLGLSSWQVHNIYKYRAKGGIYREKEDFARLYGLTVKDYRRLEPYIRISDDYRPASTLVGDTPHERRDTLRYPVKMAEGEQLMLNEADTTQLQRVPGIGSYYARQIVRYGQRLGGYVSVDQLDEIEAFPKESKQYFVVNAANIQRLNINRLTLQQLRRHPYINYYQAKAIVDYRRLHGNIKSLQELRLSRDFTPEAIQRIEPYIEY